MRPSSRTLILDAAIRVTERDGITGLTLESAAEEAGVTKGGLMYHFPTREKLLLAIHQHLTAAWEVQLLAELGTPLDQASERDIAAAYTRVGLLNTASKADLAFMVESVSSPQLAEVWGDLFSRWFPPLKDAEPPSIDLLLARLVVDGLWLTEATSGTPMPEPVKRALWERLAPLIETEKPNPA